ncbi:hypothetical protein ACUNGE_13235, partial [Serratia sp. IR-2025]
FIQPLNFVYQDILEVYKYENTLEHDRYVLWAGSPLPDELSFYGDNDKQERVKGNLLSLYLSDKGEFYFNIAAFDKAEQKSIPERFISTKILSGSKRLDFVDFCREKLKLDGEIFSFAKAVRSEAEAMKSIKRITPIKMAFTYVVNKKRENISLFADELLKNKHDSFSISGILSETQRKASFHIYYVDTKYTVEGFGKLTFDEVKEKVFKCL